MLKRLSEQRNAIDLVAWEKRQQNLTLQNEVWNLLNPIISLLSPVEEVSLLFCKWQISVQIPYARTLISNLIKLDLRVPIENDETGIVQQTIVEIEEMRKRLISELKDRFLLLENNKYNKAIIYFFIFLFRLYALATFLDPRFKNKFAEDKQIFLLRYSLIEKKLI